MSKPQMVDMWMGVRGEYRVPEAISMLGRMANERAELPEYDGTDWRQFEWFSESPYFKVVAEWGAWRDQQEQDK